MPSSFPTGVMKYGPSHPTIYAGQRGAEINITGWMREASMEWIGISAENVLSSMKREFSNSE
jgi:hypothetical protein